MRVALAAAVLLIWPCLVQSAPAALQTLESIVEEALLDEKIVATLASPEPAAALDAAPEPVITASLLEPTQGESSAKGASKLLSKPLEPHHIARALSHSAQSVCLNDCPSDRWGSYTDDGFCDDGAPSTAYCLDPTEISYACEIAQSKMCPFGHDCTDCA